MGVDVERHCDRLAYQALETCNPLRLPIPHTKVDVPGIVPRYLKQKLCNLPFVAIPG